MVVIAATGGGCKDGIPPIAAALRSWVTLVVGGDAVAVVVDVVVVFVNNATPPTPDGGVVLFRLDTRFPLLVGGDSSDFIDSNLSLEEIIISLLCSLVNTRCNCTYF